jgi:pyridoxal phosphate enzyme (YggS family)
LETQVPVRSLLRANLDRVRERIARACASAGRDPSEVRLLAVTKSVGAELAAVLVEAGQLELGESRVGELEAKATAFAARGIQARWHLIGHLQRNKARRAVQIAAAVHSVDTLRLLEALERLAEEAGRELGVYLELKLVANEERTGFAPDEIRAAAELVAGLSHLRLLGLMTIAPNDPGAVPGELATQSAALRTFERAAEIAAALPREGFALGHAELSMGMSSDLEAAIHAGAHLVRVGSALFEGLSDEVSGA